MIEITIFLILLTSGYVIGQGVEKKHYRSIIQREGRLRDLPVIASKKLPDGQFDAYDCALISGSVVISVDYFKRFVAGLRMLVGGRMTSYETLLDRARREAILRLKQQAKELDAEIIFNVKMETSSIYKGRGNSIGSVEVIAYATALSPRLPAS